MRIRPQCGQLYVLFSWCGARLHSGHGQELACVWVCMDHEQKSASASKGIFGVFVCCGLREARDGSTVGGIKSSHPRVQGLDPTPSPRCQCWRPGPTCKTNLDDPTPFNIEIRGRGLAKGFPCGGNLLFRLPTVRFYFVTENIPRVPPNRPAKVSGRTEPDNQTLNVG